MHGIRPKIPNILHGGRYEVSYFAPATHPRFLPHTELFSHPKLVPPAVIRYRQRNTGVVAISCTSP